MKIATGFPTKKLQVNMINATHPMESNKAIL